jgi:uncharacterized SAM-binding protein YcdF (DUF218 family)
MFFFSKLLSAVTQPISWVIFLWFLGLLFIRSKQRIALAVLWSAFALTVLLGFQKFPDALLRMLERQHPVPTISNFDEFKGIVVLGGATGHSSIFAAHGQVPLEAAAERMTVPVALMKAHPKLELIFTGGEGRLFVTGTTEAELAKIFFEQQGLDLSRVTLENRSRNTRENAIGVSELLGEWCKLPWLLVTSAWHMPRSMAEFQAVGCNVTAYPVDFRTGDETRWSEYSIASSLMVWQTALHEWLGIVVYKLTR